MNRSLAAETLAEVRKAAALQLWELGAILVNSDEPFQLTSGNYSPLYVNCRRLISSPGFVDLFCAAARMVCDVSKLRFDIVAGGETAGIPFAAFLARAFGRPLIYVRKGAMEHGLGSRIEGVLTLGARILLVEDLITDAGSKLSFIDAICSAGAVVEDVLVVFDRLQGGREALGKAGIRLHSVTDLDVALAVAQDANRLSIQETKAIRDYLNGPKVWHQSRGLMFRD